MSFYPECATFYSGDNLDQHALVRATYYGDNIMEVGTAFNIVFGPCGWLALALHIFGAELYVSILFGGFEWSFCGIISLTLC